MASPALAGAGAASPRADGGSQPPAERESWAYWLLASAVAAAYATAFLGTFQFDDWRAIVNEPRVQSIHAWWGSMPGIRPLLKASYAVNWASGLGLGGFHAVNVGIHLANAFLAYSLFRRLGPPRPGAALLGALLFALHPAQTEAVTYLSGRSSSLSAAFALASVVTWLARGGPRPRLARAVSPLLLLASLLVKESAIVLPLSLVLLEAAFGPRPLRLRAVLRSTAAHWIVLGLWLAAFLASPTYQQMFERSLRLRPPGANVLTHVHGLAWLSEQVLRFDLLNADPALPVLRTLTPTVAIEGAALLSALGLGLLGRRRPLGFAVSWFLLWLPASGWLLPRAEAASDRQLYLALLGPAWLAGRAIASLSPRLRVATAAGLVAWLGCATAARSLVYSDEVRFWEDVVEKSPENARAYNNLGFALARRGDAPRAEGAFLRALEVDPTLARARVNLRLLQEGEPLAPASPGEERRLPRPSPSR